MGTEPEEFSPTRLAYGSVELLADQLADRRRGFRFCRICGCTDAHPCAEGCSRDVVIGDDGTPVLRCGVCVAWLGRES